MAEEFDIHTRLMCRGCGLKLATHSLGEAPAWVCEDCTDEHARPVPPRKICISCGTRKARYGYTGYDVFYCKGCRTPQMHKRSRGGVHKSYRYVKDGPYYVLITKH